MRRAPLVVAGTVAGIAGVLAFPVHRSHLAIFSTGASAGSGTGSQSSASGSSNQSGSGGSASSSGSRGSTGSGSSGSGSSGGGSGPSTAVPATRSATGSLINFQYRDMAVEVTVTGTRITNVSIATIDETDGRSVAIDRYAIPQLERQVIAAGSANIDGVSGATFSSQAFVDSLSSALSKLGIG